MKNQDNILISETNSQKTLKIKIEDIQDLKINRNFEIEVGKIKL
jgi:hypothetical protein